MSIIEEIKLNRGIKKLRKARRKAREKTAQKRKLLYELDSKLYSKNAELDDINGYIYECKSNIDNLKERAFMSPTDINSEVGASMLLDDYLAKLYDLQCKKDKLCHEIEDIKTEMKDLQDSLNEELDEAMSK